MDRSLLSIIYFVSVNIKLICGPVIVLLLTVNHGAALLSACEESRRRPVRLPDAAADNDDDDSSPPQNARSRVKCQRPPQRRGNVVSRLRQRGKVVYYRCSANNLQLYGSPISVCINQTWNKPPPICVGQYLGHFIAGVCVCVCLWPNGIGPPTRSQENPGPMPEQTRWL